MSTLGAGLFGIGIPKDSVRSYEAQFKAGTFVIIADGTRNEVEKARTDLSGAPHCPVTVDRGISPGARRPDRKA